MWSCSTKTRSASNFVGRTIKLCREEKLQRSLLPAARRNERLYLLGICRQWGIQLDDNELVVVGFTRTDVTPEAEGEVIIVQHADVRAIEEKHVFDGREWERKVAPRAHITGNGGLRDAVRILDIQQIDGQSFFHRLAVSTKFDLVNRFEAVQIALGIITLDDQTVLVVVHDEIADVGAPWIKRVEVTLPGILSALDIEFMNEQGLRIRTGERLLEQREQFLSVLTQCHAFEAAASLRPEGVA